MPRAPKGGRGGARQGTPGTAYANRSDLNNPKLPVTAVPGQQYGAETAQKNAQAVVPMAGAPVGVGAAQPPQAQGVPDPTQAPAYAGPQPGSLPDLFGPTQNPNEHFMTGVNAGPGPGSEVLAPNPFANNQAAAILATLNSIPNPSPQVAFQKNYMAMQQENMMPH